ncbi:MAG: MBL fold metallo-hydrolase [Campylobacteraceae bacterium]|jgi:L-ascorbate metabolism protein UlaG (beta-lactamase superfamily)|nr:MBL fold metallo-hydrolase [Campylobacteraceae bacterium]
MSKKRKTMHVALLIICFIIAFIAFYLNTAKFGALPSGEYADLIQKSSNYKNGKFQNILPTPQATEGVGFVEMMTKYLFYSPPNLRPSTPIPHVKTDLLNLNKDENILIWFGHSSFFMQIEGKSILIDPVFSKNASPVPFTTKAFEGTNSYNAEDIPNIDYLVITHDHWDHLDYSTIMNLKNKIKRVILPLGVGAHFKHWGFDESMINEMDWNESIVLDNDFIIHCLTARHFSGRNLKFNQSLWASFLVKTKNFTFFVDGDSGYGEHYKDIGDIFGEIDLAIIDSGQYDKNWKYIHKSPTEVIRSALDLKAKNLLPSHIAKFALANHAWNEPLVTLKNESQNLNFSLLTPMVGEKVKLNNETQVFKDWWNF